MEYHGQVVTAAPGSRVSGGAAAELTPGFPPFAFEKHLLPLLPYTT